MWRGGLRRGMDRNREIEVEWGPAGRFKGARAVRALTDLSLGVNYFW